MDYLFLQTNNLFVRSNKLIFIREREREAANLIVMSLHIEKLQKRNFCEYGAAYCILHKTTHGRRRNIY